MTNHGKPCLNKNIKFSQYKVWRSGCADSLSFRGARFFQFFKQDTNKSKSKGGLQFFGFSIQIQKESNFQNLRGDKNMGKKFPIEATARGSNTCVCFFFLNENFSNFLFFLDLKLPRHE